MYLGTLILLTLVHKMDLSNRFAQVELKYLVLVIRRYNSIIVIK